MELNSAIRIDSHGNVTRPRRAVLAPLIYLSQAAGRHPAAVH